MQGNNLSGAPAPVTGMHRLDPRTKLLLLAASFVMLLLPENPLMLALATLVVLGHVTLARVWRALLPIRLLQVMSALFTIGIWSVLAHGPTRLFWVVSREFLAIGVANFLKLGTMMVAGLTPGAPICWSRTCPGGMPWPWAWPRSSWPASSSSACSTGTGFPA
jgi:energy-coupling factor transporter transmembrane protein EcfT